MRIIAMAVAAGDPTVFVMNPKFSPLVAADLAPAIDGILFGVMMTGGSARAAPFNIPTAIWVRYNMVGLRTFWHLNTSLCLLTVV
jgi:hypothetical protein